MNTWTKVSEFTVNIGPEKFLVTVEPINLAPINPGYERKAQLVEVEQITAQIAQLPALVEAAKTMRQFINELTMEVTLSQAQAKEIGAAIKIVDGIVGAVK